MILLKKSKKKWFRRDLNPHELKKTYKKRLESIRSHHMKFKPLLFRNRCFF